MAYGQVDKLIKIIMQIANNAEKFIFKMYAKYAHLYHIHVCTTCVS